MRVPWFGHALDLHSERQPRKAMRAVWLWLLEHENRIFGIVLGVIAIHSWTILYTRLDEYSIYISNGIYATPVLSLLSIVFSTFYVSAISAILLAARKPVARYETLLPNLLAVLAGFGVYAFGLLTPAETRPFGIILPLALLALGGAIVLLALVYLRRAFSVTPQARTVVRNGPYGLVRHPMYIGNILSIIAWALVIGTPEALALSLGACALQICRAHYEDRLLAGTFPEYGQYMSNVNAFIPRFHFGKRARLLLVVFATTGAAFLYRNASAQIAPTLMDPTLGAKCRAWHQKALSVQWFTKREGSEFKGTEDTEETLKRFPECAAFFRLQERCQEAYFGPLAAESTAARRRAEAELLRTIESIAGCKSIIGFENVCKTVREAARSQNLSPRLRSILQECADESIASRTSDMIRAGL